jgi:hypothetical protein
MNLQLKKTCADLVRLEYEMRSGPFDPRILREFRDAVDNVRKTAWAVQEWQERQSRHQDPLTVLPLLTAEGIPPRHSALRRHNRGPGRARSGSRNRRDR